MIALNILSFFNYTISRKPNILSTWRRAGTASRDTLSLISFQGSNPYTAWFNVPLLYTVYEHSKISSGSTDTERPYT